MTKFTAACMMACLLAAPAARAQQDRDFERAKALYEQALSEKDRDQRIRLLEQSAALMKTFEAFYALGNARLDQRDYGRARRSYDQAIALTSDTPALAAVYYKIALTCEGSGNVLEGIQWLQASLERSAEESVRAELRRMRLKAADVPHSEQQVARALATGKSLGAPKIDLQVHFAFNRADLTDKGETQSDGLGKLLADNPYTGYKFLFVGHTDEKGTEQYNDRLSLERAENVKKYIIERYSVAANRILVEGHGKREPLYPPKTEEDDSLNRRVEVRLVPVP